MTVKCQAISRDVHSTPFEEVERTRVFKTALNLEVTSGGKQSCWERRNALGLYTILTKF